LSGIKYKSIIIQCSWVKYLVTRILVKSNQTENAADYLVGSMTFQKIPF